MYFDVDEGQFAKTRKCDRVYSHTTYDLPLWSRSPLNEVVARPKLMLLRKPNAGNNILQHTTYITYMQILNTSSLTLKCWPLNFQKLSLDYILSYPITLYSEQLCCEHQLNQNLIMGLTNQDGIAHAPHKKQNGIFLLMQSRE